MGIAQLFTSRAAGMKKQELKESDLKIKSGSAPKARTR
jgi:hypothetical protein